ncbi:MAG: hypothetical protein UV80_C0002G0065 [Candidatus Peregrinibacteria bacterium GW2011_GWF2_43_17]|nr:MAG: hypothetical protein UV80_C0002G0065 [Candidatus Peregrinibacteria bacterium GW2011_GWF2_43_17]KKT20593.1 MAG: hypothetical protein UW03_C0002G0059 [Candidatus Peregrinibacteria bacterium GW2011_GWA2_43_8]HAU39888.1 hypothetical protein [Candidatus Peregrinibacteria bacterium]
MKKGLSLIEIIVVVTIMALIATFSIKAWSYHLVRAEFDNSVLTIVGIFQEARNYSTKNLGDEVTYDTIYYVEQTASGIIKISGDQSDVIEEYDLSDSVAISPETWQVSYEAPYADFTVVDGGDADGNLVLTVDSLKGDLSETITVRVLSGIAER